MKMYKVLAEKAGQGLEVHYISGETESAAIKKFTEKYGDDYKFVHAIFYMLLY